MNLSRNKCHRRCGLDTERSALRSQFQLYRCAYQCYPRFAADVLEDKDVPPKNAAGSNQSLSRQKLSNMLFLGVPSSNLSWKTTFWICSIRQRAGAGLYLYQGSKVTMEEQIRPVAAPLSLRSQIHTRLTNVHGDPTLHGGQPHLMAANATPTDALPRLP